MSLKINVKGVNIMKLKVKDGKVSFIMTAGKDFVRSEMNESEANNLLKRGIPHLADTTFEGFPISITDNSEPNPNTYYFAAYPEKKSKKSKEEPIVRKMKTLDEVPGEDEYESI